MIRPSPVEIPQEQLDDLQRRLAATRWPEPETVDDWSQGVPLGWMQEMAAWWQTRYDWRECEARINALGPHVTEIDGLEIHFLHVRSPHEEASPLVLTHGWPGSVVEFFDVIEPLTEPDKHGGTPEDAFHLVMPSLPGFGFSGKPTRHGWSVEKTADAWAQVMPRLGYERYFAQGGDWGAAVTVAVGMRDPEHCRGIHTNMAIARPDPDTMDDLTDAEKDALAGLKHYRDEDSGYSKQQSTRPQTIGYALVDSPVGEAAWILEKFWSWSDCGGDPLNVYSRQQLLDNVMLYWLPAAGASSARLYWESFGQGSLDPVHVPTGYSLFPKEIFRASRRWLEKRFTKLVYHNRLERGGHFAAFERPEIFVEEVRNAFRAIREHEASS